MFNHCLSPLLRTHHTGSLFIRVGGPVLSSQCTGPIGLQVQSWNWKTCCHIQDTYLQSSVFCVFSALDFPLVVTLVVACGAFFAVFYCLAVCSSLRLSFSGGGQNCGVSLHNLLKSAISLVQPLDIVVSSLETSGFLVEDYIIMPLGPASSGSTLLV